ncbi:MAG: hypothetical protein ABEK02_07500 [Haloquadratum sp.]
MVFLATALWFVVWGYVGASIVLATTSEAPASTVDVLVQGLGEFYLQSVATLDVFATATTLPARWVDVGYAVLAGIPLAVHFFLLAVALVAYDGGDPAFEVVFYAGAAVTAIASSAPESFNWARSC